MEGSHNLKANEWVLSWLGRLLPGARVLDFASGQGRHALAAASLGLQAFAWDRDATSLNSLAQAGSVETLVCDLELDAWPSSVGKFDAVLVTNYLFRPRLALLAELLNDGGVLIYQTFASGHETLGRPRRADFLLQPGELFQVALLMGLHVLSYEDSVLAAGGQIPADEGQHFDQSMVSSQVLHGMHFPPTARIQRLVALKHGRSQASPKVLSAWPVNIEG
jgi:SAM-dependent methyltransferase